MGAVLLLAAGVMAIRPVLSKLVQRRLVERVERHFDGTVDVRTLRVSLVPAIRITGAGLTLRRRADSAAPPLITVDEFRLTTSLWRLFGGGVRRLEITGMDIRIPAGQRDAPDTTEPGAPSNDTDGRDLEIVRGVTIDRTVATDVRLEIAPEEADGTPLVFNIRSVRLDGFSPVGPAGYEAELTNPRPRGEIASTGSFGPWRADQPRLTPLSGEYTLSHADMSVFNGLGGTLESAGRFDGVLEAISVSGTTTMPDFQVHTGSHPMPLDTTFEARVDGTNGNTYLDRVSARLAGSAIEASGEIAGTREGEGKTIRLEVAADAARLEDFIYLVVSQVEPLMSGGLGMQARLELPPGEGPVPERLVVDGRFQIRQGRFASDDVQEKVDELSRRGRGEPENASIDRTLSDFEGRFMLRNGRLRLPDLRFKVRGAEVKLAGEYRLRGEVLDFEGELRLDASLSRTTTGFKSFLLRIIDPLFRRRGAGAVLPIRVTGTVSEPRFGLNVLGRAVGLASRPPATGGLVCDIDPRPSAC
jgi:hypothetical protein